MFYIYSIFIEPDELFHFTCNKQPSFAAMTFYNVVLTSPRQRLFSDSSHVHVKFLLKLGDVRSCAAWLPHNKGQK